MANYSGDSGGSKPPAAPAPDPSPYTGGGLPPDMRQPPAAPNPPPPSGGGGGGGGGGGSGGGGGGGAGGSGGGSGSSSYDINSILAADPAYQQLLAFDQGASSDDLATMNAEIAKMQGYYGSDSDPLSILGRIYQALQDKNMLIANTLAGHGMINSGETGWQASRATLNYQQAELDARMKLQDYIDGLNQAYQQELRQQKFNEMTASWTAVQNYLANNPATAPPVSTSG